MSARPDATDEPPGVLPVAAPADAPEGAPADRSLDDAVTRWLEAILAGERAGAAWLYDRFARPLFRRLCGRYAGHPGIELEDLLHDAFVLFFQNDGRVLRAYLDRTPPPARTMAGLERRLWDLTCGLAANRRRSAKGRRWQPLPAIDRPSPRPTPEHDLLGRDELNRLDSCLEAHGERLYLYFKLRFQDGLKPREIVRATGWSTKVTYKLRQALGDAVAACVERLGLAPNRSVPRRSNGGGR